MKVYKKIKPELKDTRGHITKLIDDGSTTIKSILLITSRKGAVRSNHYHKKDTHYIYVISGRVAYYEKSLIDKKARLKKVVLSPGDMVFTPAMSAHTTIFLEDSVIMAFSTRFRNKKSYEDDLIRMQLVD